MIDRHPRIVVRRPGPDDVAPTIAFARDAGLALADPRRRPQRRRQPGRSTTGSCSISAT
jgi:hypothetical protein